MTMTTIYQVNDCDWVAADSLDQAVGFYTKMTGDPETVDDPFELDAAALETTTFTNEEDGFWGIVVGECSFASALAAALASGEQPPFFFASTEQ
jgi:hypothetical protein